VSAADPTAADQGMLAAIARAPGWVLDVDGCLVRTATAGGVGGIPVLGTADLLAWLRRGGRDVVVCTNASERPAATYAAQLRSAGLEIGDEQMVTAATAAADYIARHHPDHRVLAIGAEGLTHALREAGIEPVGPRSDRLPDVVVVGAAPSYAAADLNAGCLALADGGGSFYVTVDIPWFHGGLGRSLSVSSAVAAAITAVTGRRPQVCGKPSPALAEVLNRRLGGPARDVVVVGDTASVEMQLAHTMKALGVLVMSGGTSEADLASLPAEHRPHLRVADVGMLHELVLAAESKGDPA
jgi:NagD protein